MLHLCCDRIPNVSQPQANKGGAVQEGILPEVICNADTETLHQPLPQHRTDSRSSGRYAPSQSYYLTRYCVIFRSLGIRFCDVTVTEYLQFFESGKVAIEVALHNFGSWGAIVPGKSYQVPLLGQVSGTFRVLSILLLDS